MTIDDFGVRLNTLRTRAAKKFKPGLSVCVKKHGVAGEKYDNIWLSSKPGGDIEQGKDLDAGSVAIVISVVDIQLDGDDRSQRWVLLLATSELFGWTLETEGLEVLSTPKR